MIFKETKCHVNTSLRLVGGMHPLHPPLCPRLLTSWKREHQRNEPLEWRRQNNTVDDEMDADFAHLT